MAKRILAIDDEKNWLDNFRAWIPEELAELHTAQTTGEAISYLRKYYYDLVLLDLSMDLEADWNRENKIIQDYLSTHPDGTRYIIISGTAERDEVRDAFSHHGVSDIIFKTEIEASLLQERIHRVFDESTNNTMKHVAEAVKKLIPNRRREFQISSTVDAKGGASVFNEKLRSIIRKLAPISYHKKLPHLVVYEDIVAGILWSRQMGQAMSLAMCNDSVSEEEATNQLSNWLGFVSRGDKMFEMDKADKKKEANEEATNLSRGARILVYREDSLTEKIFQVPDLSLVNN